MLLLLRFLRLFTFFFWKSKNVTFYVFCFASHVFSNYSCAITSKALQGHFPKKYRKTRAQRRMFSSVVNSAAASSQSWYDDRNRSFLFLSETAVASWRHVLQAAAHSRLELLPPGMPGRREWNVASVVVNTCIIMVSVERRRRRAWTSAVSWRQSARRLWFPRSDNCTL